MDGIAEHTGRGVQSSPMPPTAIKQPPTQMEPLNMEPPRPSSSSAECAAAQEALHRALSDQLSLQDGPPPGPMSTSDVRESTEAAAADHDAAHVAEGGSPDGPGDEIPSADDDAAAHDAEANTGKVFVGGLNWRSTPDGVRAFFSRFGVVKSVQIMRDQTSGKSRGFGFVSFADPKDAQRVVDNPDNEIYVLDEKQIDPKIALPKSCIQRGKAEPIDTSKNKVFIGGLSQDTSVAIVKECFQAHGDVVDVVLMYDRVNKRPRGFGFVTFTNEAPVDALVAQQFVDCNGRMIEVKKALPKDESAAHRASLSQGTGTRGTRDGDGGGGDGGGGRASGLPPGSVLVGHHMHGAMHSPAASSGMPPTPQQYTPGYPMQEQHVAYDHNFAPYLHSPTMHSVVPYGYANPRHPDHTVGAYAYGAGPPPIHLVLHPSALHPMHHIPVTAAAIMSPPATMNPPDTFFMVPPSENGQHPSPQHTYSHIPRSQ